MANIIGNTMSANASNFYHHHFHIHNARSLLLLPIHSRINIMNSFRVSVHYTIYIAVSFISYFMRNEKLVRARHSSNARIGHTSWSEKNCCKAFIFRFVVLLFQCASKLIYYLFFDRKCTTHILKRRSFFPVREMNDGTPN